MLVLLSVSAVITLAVLAAAVTVQHLTILIPAWFCFMQLQAHSKEQSLLLVGS